MSDKKLVLIGDIISSRQIEERNTFNRQLLKTLDDLNSRNSSVISPYTLTIGDEIQAVFKNAKSIFRDAISIMTAIHPHKMRFSFSIGSIINPINPKQAIGMDGPAFHLARDGIERLKKSGFLFSLKGENIQQLSFYQQVLLLISHNIFKWNKTRLHVLEMSINDIPVNTMAKKLQISEQAIYKNINAGALEIIISLFIEIEKTLNHWLEGEQ